MKDFLKSKLLFFDKKGHIIITFSLLIVILITIWLILSSKEGALEPLIIAAVSALFAAVSSIGSLMQTVELRKQRETLERPIVYGYFDSSSGGLVSFFIENRGFSAAKNIHITINPVPIDFKGRPINTLSMLSRPISFLQPGKVMQQVIMQSYMFFEEEYPLEYTIKIDYSDLNGEVFSEIFEFDMGCWKDAKIPRKSMKENLEEISRHLKKMAG